MEIKTNENIDNGKWNNARMTQIDWNKQTASVYIEMSHGISLRRTEFVSGWIIVEWNSKCNIEISDSVNPMSNFDLFITFSWHIFIFYGLRFNCRCDNVTNLPTFRRLHELNSTSFAFVTNEFHSIDNFIDIHFENIYQLLTILFVFILSNFNSYFNIILLSSMRVFYRAWENGRVCKLAKINS